MNNGTRSALIVATDQYEDPGLRRLQTPMDDAKALEGVLKDPLIGGFDVKVVPNQPWHEIQREIGQFLSNRHPEDLLLIHFACHGIKDAASGELYLAGCDTAPANLRATALSTQFLDREMMQSRARRVVLLLDCCFGGAFARGMTARANDSLSVEDAFPKLDPRPKTDVGRGRVVITASSAIEYAFEYDELVGVQERRPSVFTAALVDGLSSGKADAGRDGHVDLDELYDYVFAQSRNATPPQTPQKLTNVAGKIYIASVSPAAMIEAAEVSEEVADQIQDPRAEERLTAVEGLRQTLLGHDLAQAAGALDALRELANDEHTRVSVAASAAVEEAQLKVMPSRVDLGEIQPGRSAERDIRLVGSPLARLCQVVTNTRWIRIDRPAGTQHSGDSPIRLAVDRSALGEASGLVEGSIRVINRIGEVEVPVSARARTVSLGPIKWAQDLRLLVLVSVVLTAATLPNQGDVIDASQLLGAGYYVVRFGLLAAAVLLVSFSGARQAVGLGIMAATGCYALADASVEVHDSEPSAAAWLELFAAVVFVLLILVRAWPYSGVPRRVEMATMRQPLTYLVLAAALVQLLLLFIPVPPSPDSYRFESSTLAQDAGTLSALLAVGPVAALCCGVALTRGLDRGVRTFVGAAVAAYYVPELYLLVSSFLFGGAFSYFGANIYDSYGGAKWLVLLEATATAVILVSTMLLVAQVRSESVAGRAPT